MKVNGAFYRTIWPAADGVSVEIIDQTRLPHTFQVVRLNELAAVAHAITAMLVRGAPLIGAAAAYGLALGLRQDPSDSGIEEAAAVLLATRPTAVNLRWAVERLRRVVEVLPPVERAAAAWREAALICDEDVALCHGIGACGAGLIRAAAIAKPHNTVVNVLTHCNAGWLAAVDWGTALAPIYLAHAAGISLHVWVDETRPRNQGASLTAWELREHGVPHTVIADNAGGHLMQHGLVDLCIVGTDRVTATGDVCNKIGTYLKALAAHDNGVPFYVALPSPTIDWRLEDGVRGIPIEQRDPRELTHIEGRAADGQIVTVQVTPDGSVAANYAFDVTPARLITGLITEVGICTASRAGLSSLFPGVAAKEAM